MNRAAAFLLAVAVPSIATPVDADVPPSARLLAARGRAAYEVGDYRAAAAAFEDAFALAPSSPLLFDLAQAYRLSGKCELAVAHYQRFLETSPPTDARMLAERHSAAMRRCVAEAPAPASETPSPPVAVDDAALVAGSNRRRIERDVGLGLGLGGGVALIAALFYAVAAHDASDAVDDAYAHGGSGAAIARLDASGREDAKLGTVAGVAGIAAIGAGAILYYLGHRDTAHRALAVVPHRDGMEVRAEWRF